MSGRERETAQAVPFLGQEFLLWLYWRSSSDPYFFLENLGLGSIDLRLEEQITLESLRGEGYRETIQTQEVALSDDIRDSVRTGRIPVAARVKASRGKAEWQFILTALPLAIRSVKLPAPEKSDDDETMHLRLIQMEEIDRIMRALFKIFLAERTNPAFVSDIRTFLGLER